MKCHIFDNNEFDLSQLTSYPIHIIASESTTINAMKIQISKILQIIITKAITAYNINGNASMGKFLSLFKIMK